MRTLLAAVVVALLAPGVASAVDFSFGDTNADPGQNNMNALMLPSKMARDQAEIQRVQAETWRLQQENEMRRLDLEDRRAMRCQLPDGRRVECR